MQNLSTSLSCPEKIHLSLASDDPGKAGVIEMFSGESRSTKKGVIFHVCIQ